MRLRSHPFLVAFCVLMLLLTLGGVWLAPFAPDEIVDIPFSSVSAQHWLGTDYLGADVLSRVLSGGQMLVLAGIGVVVVAWLLAGSLGMLAALRGGMVDKLVLMVVDLLQSVPGMLLVLLLALITGQQGYLVAALSATLISGADIVRIARSATLQAMQHDYIDIARLRGESTAWILCCELAPGLLSLISADAAVRFIVAVFMMASVSFLGFGASPPQADWGLMIMENRDGFAVQPLAVLAPVLALLLLLLPLTLLADVSGSTPPMRQPRKPKWNPNPQAAIVPQNSVAADILTNEIPASADATSLPLIVNNFGLNIGTKRLLDNIQLTLNAGEITALTGASAAGKTTLLHAMAGELPIGSVQISGSILLAGQPILSLSASQCRLLRRRHIGYLPQDPRVALLPLQRAGSLLQRRAASLGIKGKQAKALIARQLEIVALPADNAFLRRRSHQLSGGQRQRLLLALALMGNPRLLLLDEPGSAQDSVNTRALYQHVRRLALERGIAVLLVAHDIREVSGIADNFVVLDQGKIQEISRCEAFLRQPKSVAGQRLMQAARLNVSAATSQPKATRPGLEVCELCARHGELPALDHISFTLLPGGCLNIIGASGCGKTTLLRSLLGLHPACAGTICWQNTPISAGLGARSRSERRRLQYVPQNPYDSLNPWHTVQQLLYRPLHLFSPHLSRSEVQQQISKTLEQVGLPVQLCSQRVKQLSGGQRQRVALARALLAQPEILICDEVTSALDLANRQALINLLMRLRIDHNLTLIMVTHDLAQAAQCAGDIIVIDNGRIIESGTVAQVMNAPRHPLTRSLLEFSGITNASNDQHATDNKNQDAVMDQS